jgi:hypothetical protein
MSAVDEHTSHAAQAFGECLNAFLADAQALGMADGNHLEDERVHIGPTDI